MPPFGPVMDLGDRAKASWSAGGGEPPVPHCGQLEIPLDEGLARLRASGFEASASTPMKDLADRHDRRPHDLVQILVGA